MKSLALGAALLAFSASALAADPPAAAPPDACLMLNNRILGPRSANRPLPLMRETSDHAFAPACSVAWSVISPQNEALAVDGCYHGSLLRIANDTACGTGSGKLWISARWVVTSADLAQAPQHAAICQKLETGAWAGTRALTLECQPRARELSGFKAAEKPPKSAAPSAPAAQPADHPQH